MVDEDTQSIKKAFSSYQANGLVELSTTEDEYRIPKGVIIAGNAVPKNSLRGTSKSQAGKWSRGMSRDSAQYTNIETKPANKIETETIFRVPVFSKEDTDQLPVESYGSFGDFPALPHHVLTDLYWFSVSERVPPARVEDIKRALKESLNIPDYLPIFIFTDSSGNAWSKNSAGQVLVEGHLSISFNDSAVSHVGFSFNATIRRLHIDGVEVRHYEVPKYLEGLKGGLVKSISFDEVFVRAESRAQVVFFCGEFIKHKTDNTASCSNTHHLIVTQNYLSPHQFHVYLGNSAEMNPLALDLRPSLLTNMGVLLSGLSRQGSKHVVFIPYRNYESVASLFPSVDGIPMHRTMNIRQGAVVSHIDSIACKQLNNSSVL